ncbi:Smr/MutS family protein [Mycoplasmopsis columbina]|uniref:Smr domain-containing protein n=1 Tax=Mycoplasmopsis columbina SF7 TaxID=1037410 RepID=F9UJW1_9BACT|nr:Smr/MutS family protein [Mycoplasmopsis columbina]EGV00307.1 hypothetical protein MCSF7_00839 [Mycoplasmopsis columbina SF7]VEU76829.1 Smr domain-containing protein [Mycoplasmopsis columbina]
MFKQIDLHGLDQIQALSKVELAFLDAQEHNISKIEIITGKGSKTLFTVVEDYLMKHDYSYAITNDNGAFEVYLEQDYWDDEEEDNYCDVLKEYPFPEDENCC